MFFGVLEELVERCIEENVAVGFVFGHKVEGGVAGSYDCYGAGMGLVAVPVCEVVFFAECFELLRDEGPGVAAVGFEVDEEDERLVGVLIEDAVAGRVGEGGVLVHLVEEVYEGVDVEVSECSISCE